MKKSFISSALKVISGAMVIAFAAILPLFPLSCKLSDDDSSTESESTSSESGTKDSNDFPEIVNFSVLDENSVQFNFSAPVSISNVSFCKVGEEEQSVDYSSPDCSEKAVISLPESTLVGNEYVVKGTASNAHGDTGTFERKFYGYNKDSPILILSEVRTEYLKTGSAEFIEFYVLRGGNIGGFKINTATIEKMTALEPFVMPSIYVKTGDYVTVHFRTLIPETSFTEINGNIKESKSKDSCDTAWDIWVQGDSKYISSTDIILLEDLNNSIMDCLILSKTTNKNWTKKQVALIERCKASDIWESGTEIADVVNTDNSTATQTVCRKNVEQISVSDKITVTASDWGVVKTKKATPGYKNSEEYME